MKAISRGFQKGRKDKLVTDLNTNSFVAIVEFTGANISRFILVLLNQYHSSTNHCNNLTGKSYEEK